MRNLFLLISIIFITISCDKNDALTIEYPKEYLPAYPGSIWYYSNGDVSKVHTNYVAHRYQPYMNSTEYTTEKLVPFIDNKYLYGYDITQNSMSFPLKTLLSETSGKPWIVDTVGTEKIYRETVQLIDSMYLRFPSDENPLDSVLYYDVLEVVEYLNSFDNTEWNIKEFYSKNIGLIRVEINSPYDTFQPVVQKQLVNYNINN